MQLHRTTLDGTSGGITELSVLTNQEYIDAAIAASLEEPGYDVILGTNLIGYPHGRYDPTTQTFVLFARAGMVINTTLVPE